MWLDGQSNNHSPKGCRFTLKFFCMFYKTEEMIPGRKKENRHRRSKETQYKQYSSHHSHDCFLSILSAMNPIHVRKPSIPFKQAIGVSLSELTNYSILFPLDLIIALFFFLHYFFPTYFYI